MTKAGETIRIGEFGKHFVLPMRKLRSAAQTSKALAELDLRSSKPVGNLPLPKDASDLWREWVGRPPHSTLTLQDDIVAALMTLTPEKRTDRAIVNEAVRTQRSPWRPAGSGRGISPLLTE
jgi:hypothetical protein